MGNTDPNDRMDSLGITSQLGSGNLQLNSGRPQDGTVVEGTPDNKMIDGLNQYIGQKDSNKIQT